MALRVKDFYNTHYKRFDSSRYRVWKAVREFVENIPKNSFVFESGCGNGKNLIYMNNHGIKTCGIDFSYRLVDICKKKGLNVDEADIRSLPYKDNTFDYVISIAVIHHLHREKDRIKSINEMIRVCKPGGKILVSCWSVEQEADSKRNFVFGDNSVKWVDTERYYYIYDEIHIKEFLKNFNVEKLFWEKGNWFFILST